MTGTACEGGSAQHRVGATKQSKRMSPLTALQSVRALLPPGTPRGLGWPEAVTG